MDQKYQDEPSRVEEEGGPIVFPGPLQLKLSRWLKGDPVLLQKADLQKVVQVIHVSKANDIFWLDIRNLIC